MKNKIKRATAPVFLFFFSICPFLAFFISTVSSLDLPSHLKTSEVQTTQGKAISWYNEFGSSVLTIRVTLSCRRWPLMSVSSAIRESTWTSNGFELRDSHIVLLSKTARELYFGLSVCLDGGDASLTLETSTSGRLDSSLSSKRNSATTQHPVNVQYPDPAPQVKSCQLGKEILDQIPKRSMSEWIVDDTVMKSLLDDPQELVQCTSPYEKIILKLQQSVKLPKTIKIVHELELIGESVNATGGNEEGVAFPTFTCPLEGPVFSINTSHFVATRLRIVNCTKSASKAAVIIDSNSKVTFNRTSFKENKSGAIYIYQGANVTIIGASFNENEAIEGGAIYANDNSNVEVVNSTFKGNKADSIGGAIYAKDSVKMKVLDSTFSNNSAQYGGGMLLARNNLLALSRTSFLNNDALRKGGGTYAYINNSLTISECIFSNNIANGDGGGIDAYKSNSLVINNSAQRYGGGMYAYNGNELVINASNFSYNSALFGGGISLGDDDSLMVASSIFSNNFALRKGGALNMDSRCIATINQSTLSNNKAQFGGGTDAYINNTLTINNSAQVGGGGLLSNTDNLLTIDRSMFLNNNAQGDGGGTYAFVNNSLCISECTFSSKFVPNILNSNGRITLSSTSVLLVYHRSIHSFVLRISGNKAMWRGGALKLESYCHINVENSSMTDNDAIWGGGLLLERSVVARVSSTYFSSNNASRGGGIYVEFGGCLFGASSSTKVQYSNHWNNFASQSGGCFYIKSSIANFEANTFNLNQAKKNGGAIHAYFETVFYLKEDKVTSNSAFNGGGIALISDSRILCESGIFQNNIANGGGAVYIESQMTQVVIAQFGKSTFLNNSASQYGGGIAIKTFGRRSFDCKRANEPCSRILLINTSFTGNIANHCGSAILATTPKNVLAACENPRYFEYTRFQTSFDIEYFQRESSLKMVSNSSSHCKAWKDNKVVSGAHDQVIGTFGQKINITTNSMNGPQIIGDSYLGYSLYNVTSGVPLPTIKITTIDIFGNNHAPTLHSDALVLSNNDGFLRQSIGLSFKNDACVMTNIIGLVKPGFYSLQMKLRYDDDTLEETNLTVVVRGCIINDESTMEGKLCLECGEASYNFNSAKGGKCASCPEGATCTERYIVPTNGYWHKSPCHDKMKKCIVEEACTYSDRIQGLSLITQNATNCILNRTSLDEYGEAQCNEGYEGCLCGSCKKSYGRTPALECLECQSIVYSLGRLLGIILLLLIETGVTMKGTLGVASKRLLRQYAMRLLRETTSSSSVEVRRSDEGVEIDDEGDVIHQESTHLVERTVTHELLQKAVADATQAQCTALESWKVNVNDER